MKFTFAPESRPLDGFTIKRAIYRGGFGEVYYAQSDAGREVALKLLQNNAEIELRGVQQCLNLSHPNLVTIFDVKQDNDGDHWIVMEYVAGETLDTILRKTPQGLPVEVVRKWLHGMTEGLSYLHSRGLVHRDMKPANVFMENGVVKIGDIGLSKFISPSRHSAQTQSVGTVHYMAPEVAKGKYGREVDVYALGIMLYEMLTGQLPFDGESTGEILMKHLSEEPDLEKVPPRLRHVIGKALRKDPKERYSRVEALQRAFDDAVLGLDSPPSDKQHAYRSVEQPSPTELEETSWSKGTEQVEETKAVPLRFRLSWPAIILGLVGLLFFIRLGGASPMGGRLAIAPMILFGGVGLLAYHLLTRPSSRSNDLSHRKTRVYTPPKPETEYACLIKDRDLWGALFVTVPVSAALIGCLAMLKPTLLGTSSSIESIDAARLGLFSGVTVLSSWLLLGLTFVTQGYRKLHKIPRYQFILVGMLVGSGAYLLDEYLMVNHIGEASHAMFSRLGDHRLVTDGLPTFFGYLVFFSAFFGLRNWRDMTKSFRDKRFSVTEVLITLFTGWLSSQIFSFPAEFAIAWAVVIACVVQLAAPFEEKQKRSHRVA